MFSSVKMLCSNEHQQPAREIGNIFESLHLHLVVEKVNVSEFVARPFRFLFYNVVDTNFYMDNSRLR